MGRPRGYKCKVCTQRCFPRKCNPALCPSCLLFGWRALDTDQVFACKLQNSCNIAENRRRCRACRLRKVAASWEEFHTKKSAVRNSRITRYRRIRLSTKVMQYRMLVAAMDAGMLNDGLAPEGTAAENRNEGLLPSQNAASAVGQYDQTMMQAILENTIEENLEEEMLDGTDEPGISNETSTGPPDSSAEDEVDGQPSTSSTESGLETLAEHEDLESMIGEYDDDLAPINLCLRDALVGSYMGSDDYWFGGDLSIDIGQTSTDSLENEIDPELPDFIINEANEMRLREQDGFDS